MITDLCKKTNELKKLDDVLEKAVRNIVMDTTECLVGDKHLEDQLKRALQNR